MDNIVAGWSKGTCTNSVRCIFLSMLIIIPVHSNWPWVVLIETMYSHGKYVMVTQNGLEIGIRNKSFVNHCPSLCLFLTVSCRAFRGGLEFDLLSHGGTLWPGFFSPIAGLWHDVEMSLRDCGLFLGWVCQSQHCKASDHVMTISGFNLSFKIALSPDCFRIKQAKCGRFGRGIFRFIFSVAI